ncbi:damage-control phosphatase ARMT1 family protein [Streptomyces profundus]|uniref:damage-control phosphatase ARMT1 family protein n=1 Tax=Streptomyces profundus TaxID=2867410 RepID=UPI001D16CBAD|nr:damage-control phosphatase ARMT1 family protein [Streptomyces sp. MA3_2.13]UED83928.1 protein-glutamate O-methyltransferase family protein [Streptomyces sp. MA3_2.13]
MSGTDEAPVILGNPPGSFAHGVLTRRNPAIVQQVRDALPRPPAHHRALDTLLVEITEGVVEPPAPEAHDRAAWDVWGRPHFGRPWPEVPFLWAESYFYRQLLSAVDYFGPGPWRGVDPFGPAKAAELEGAAVDAELAALDQLVGRPAGERRAALLGASLWGNRADLSFAAGGAATGGGAGDAPLVADDQAALWSLLDGRAPAEVAFVADNAGRELVPDLVLIDHLLDEGGAARVALHIKPVPYYVSDATTADVVAALRRLRAAPGQAGAVGERLWAAVATGRLTVDAHPFLCAPLPFDGMPDDLRRQLAGADLTIVKGDLNYRRLVGDRRWPATSPFAARTAAFPGPVAALRTLKSDVIVGLTPETLAALDSADTAEAPWRTGGSHALVQVAS